MNAKALRLIKKYLDGETTLAETRYVREVLVRQLVGEDEDVNEFLANEWSHTSSENKAGISIDEAWLEFRERISKEQLESRPLWKRWLVAASISVVIASAAFYFSNQSRHDGLTAIVEKVTYTEKQTDRGEKLNIALPDGTSIRLNSSTSLRIPSDFTNKRMVYLHGEAFFEVAKDESKPFKVITGPVVTEVLGTSFNVTAFVPDEKVSVAVIEGKVRVANSIQAIELDRKEMTTVGPDKELLTKSDFDEESVIGWRNNILLFDQVSFDQVIEILKEWYGVDFVLEGESIPKGLYSGRFENKSLQLVLDGLGFSSDFEYKIVDKVVFLRF